MVCDERPHRYQNRGGYNEFRGDDLSFGDRRNLRSVSHLSHSEAIMHPYRIASSHCIHCDKVILHDICWEAKEKITVKVCIKCSIVTKIESEEPHPEWKKK